MRVGFLKSIGVIGILSGSLPTALAQSQLDQAQAAPQATAAQVGSAQADTPQPGTPQADTAQRGFARGLGRPVVGLVLSGGGARGGAHLGVIRALEELRVPIDLIAGTSIGAAIGGIYASGLSVDELDAFLRSIDWDAAFLNTTPRQLRSFRRKRDDDLFLVDQRPGLNDGEFQLPTGVVQGQVIDTIMARTTLPVTDVDDFDDLSIPFRAVAGDLVTGEAVILGGGNLGRAVRASMTVPAALTPMEIDGRLLVDGGIAMNLPVEVGKSLGADVIIAVDISEQLITRDEINSVVDVTGQLTSLLTRFGTEQQLALLTDDDVLLTPVFTEEFSSVSFGRLVDTIQTGYDIVMANRGQFEGLALSPQAYAAHLAQRQDPRQTEMPTVDFVRLNNNSSIADSIIETRLKEIEIGEPLDLDALEVSLNRVYGLELFQNVRYEVVEENGATGLELDLDARSWGPNYLQLGVEYSSTSDQNAVFGLAASYLRTSINDLGGEARATFLVGDEPAFLVDLYQPLGPKGLYFFSPTLLFESDLLNVFDGKRVAAELKLRSATLEIAGGREFMSWGEVRGGVRTGYGETDLRIGDPTFVPFVDFNSGEFFTRFSVDTLDDIAFPRQGLFTTAEWRGSRTSVLSADSNFDQLLIDVAVAKTWGRHTMLSTLRYDTTVSGTAPVYGLFQIGGFLDLSGLNNDQLSGQHAARIGTSYYRRIGDLALFPAFAGVSVELGNAWSSRSDISLNNSRVGGSLWAGVDTPIGPVYMGYGFAEGGDTAFYVFLGSVF